MKKCDRSVFKKERRTAVAPMGVIEHQKASRNSFELDELKVTFKKDLTTTVSDLEISGRDGEMLTLPRWAARELEKDGYVSVTEIDMSSALKQAMSKENAQNDFQLSTLDDHFYIRLDDYMRRLDDATRKEMSSMLNTLVRSRTAKISRLVALSDLSPATDEKLTVEEKELYTELRKLYVEFKESVMGVKA